MLVGRPKEHKYRDGGESNLPSRSTVISTAAGAIDFFDYVFDYVFDISVLNLNNYSNSKIGNSSIKSNVLIETLITLNNKLKI